MTFKKSYITHYRQIAFAWLITMLSISCKEDDSLQLNQAPIFEDQSFTIAETTKDNRLIGTLAANDPNNDLLTFEILIDTSRLFTVDSTGILSVAEGEFLDFETKSNHTIIVKVSDGFFEDQAKVQITVIDVLEKPFITTWMTNSANEAITIPTNSRYQYRYEVKWGDGTTTEESGNATHIYANEGLHKVEISGIFPAIRFLDSSNENRQKITSIDQWGDIMWKDMNSAFFVCSNLNSNAADVPNLVQVTDMTSMFTGAVAFNGPIGNWDVSTIINMSGLFVGATSFNQNIENWDMSGVQFMGDMFVYAESFNQNISDWDVSNVTDMESMLFGTTTFDQDLSSWNVSQVTRCNGFFEASALKVENLPNFRNCTP